MGLTTVQVPDEMELLFAKAEAVVSQYFRERQDDPSRGTIEIFGERYMLVRGAALSVEFFSLVKDLFGEGRKAEAEDFARNMLFDLAHAIGKSDAKNFHTKMKLSDPIERLSAGPVHFSHTGWAFVDIFPESRPSPDENYYLIYDHPQSFEADTWLRSQLKPDFPACIMNAGYSSGWCEESFGVPLVATEILCRAKGDPCCRFIMAPPDRIEEHVAHYMKEMPHFAHSMKSHTIPDFFSRKRLEEDLRRNEEQYRGIFEATADALIIVDTNGVIVDANPAASKMYGYEHAEFIGLSPRTLVHPDYHHKLAEFMRQVPETGWFHAETIDVRKDGSTFDVEVHGNSFLYKGQPHLLAVLRDITERKRAEEALHKAHDELEQRVKERTTQLTTSNQQLQQEIRERKRVEAERERLTTIAEGTSDFVAIATPDAHVVYMNSAGRRMLGIGDNEDITGTMIGDTHPEWALRIVEDEGLPTAAEKGVWEGETSLLGPDGAEIPVSQVIMSYKSSSGKLEYFSTIMRDISERKRTEAELRAHRDHLETMVAERTAELRHINIELEAQRQELEAQQVELMAANTDLQDAKIAAEAANQTKSQFLANMSHEIRTPMTAILGFAEVLLEYADLGDALPEQIEAVRVIKRNGEYLLGIINDILDLSKIEAGKMYVEKVACSPCQILAEIAPLLRVPAEAKGLPFNMECIGPIPETIRTDPTRLRQILINVVANAIKFTEVGSVRLIARFVEDAGEPLMQFDVVDTGLGMSEEQVAKLFQPFIQADASTTRKFGGTGLGLTISRRFAQMLGGDIVVVETQPGIGTNIRVTVGTGLLDGVNMIKDPMSVTLIDTGTSDTALEAGELPLHGCRILLAEDGPDNQRLITHVLKKAGAEITVVENGELAVDAALVARDEGRPFGAILMDMQMPIMDGYEATRLLRQKGYTEPIIALTAHAMEGDREKCTKAGCDDYTTKPIVRQELIKMLQKHLCATMSS